MKRKMEDDPAAPAVEGETAAATTATASANGGGGSSPPPAKRHLQDGAAAAAAAAAVAKPAVPTDTVEGEAGGQASPPAAAAPTAAAVATAAAAAAAASTGGNGGTMEVAANGTANGGVGGQGEEGGGDAGVDMGKLLTRPTPFGVESGKLALGEFEAGEDLKELLGEARVLVVGAGGLGCEILKNLALSGVKDIDVIDLDTIELSNLNRQFLFRETDIGRPKAEVAAEFVMRRCPGVTVRAHHGKIQEKGPDFYREFSVVIAGLDNIKARIWLNSTLHALAERDEATGEYDLTTVVPLIDGGTEGFQGQARVIIPGKTACFHCTLDLFPPARGFQLCTIADTPRQPEHCIAYVQLMSWPEAHPDTTLDADNPENVAWVCERAQARAAQYGIEGVTYRLTLGVIKNIIPAVASTNAVIAAVSVQEALKVLTFVSQVMDNYMMYQGPEGVYTYTTAHLKKEDCLVCGTTEVKFPTPRGATLGEFMEALKTNPELQLAAPSLSFGDTVLYMQRPPALEQATRPNLAKAMGALVGDGEELSITDPSVNQPVTVVVQFTD